MNHSMREITARPRERWGDAWLREHDPDYVPGRAGRRAARPEMVDTVVAPVAAEAASGDEDVAAAHVGGALTPALLRKRRIDRGTHHAVPLIAQWGTRRGNGKDGVLRRALDREYAARVAGQAAFSGRGFDTAGGGT